MSSEAPVTSIKSVCILRLSAIGDVTHVLPVVHSLREQLPGVSISWVVGKAEARLLEGLPGVELIVFDKNAGLKGYIDLWRRLRKRRFDVLSTCRSRYAPTSRPPWFPPESRSATTGARSKDLHGLFINRRIHSCDRQHVLDCLASFPTALGLEPAPPRWNLPSPRTITGSLKTTLIPRGSTSSSAPAPAMSSGTGQQSAMLPSQTMLCSTMGPTSS